MLNITTFNELLKIVVPFLCSFFVFSKITNYKNISKIKFSLIVLSSVFISVLRLILMPYLSYTLLILMLCVLCGIAASLFFKEKIDFSIIIMTISLGLSYIFYLISVTLSAALLLIVFHSNNPNHIVCTFTIPLFQFLAYFCFFSIRRFRNGFPFFRKNTVKIFCILFGGLVIICATFIGGQQKDNHLFIGSLIAGISICAIAIVIWIRMGITSHYKQKMKEHAVELLEEKIQEKDKELEEIKHENMVLSSVNHKFNQRFSALEMSVKALAFQATEAANCAEIAPEFANVIEQIKTMSQEYKNEIQEKLPKKKALPTTKIQSIDSLFTYFQLESSKSNIDFNLKITGSIPYMIEKLIPQNKLETLIGDHIRDAIIAINFSENTYRSILVLLGEMNDCNELCVFDSGIEFQIDTLLSLGLKAITTHKDTGGSGIGFMTTFETMKECKASLIIEEKQPNKFDFTKSVSIRFDGKNQFVIKSYRAKEIRERNTDDRIIIEDAN